MFSLIPTPRIHYPRKVTLYLGMRMRYEAGNCAIVISMKKILKWCPKNVFHCLIFAQNCTQPKAIHGFSWFWVKIQPIAKWTSFECSLHADHNGTNPSFISHSQPKIPSKVYTKRSTLICIQSVKWKTHRTLLCEWDMKLGIVPLWSAWKDLSNDVLRVDFNVGHIFWQKAHSTKGYI